MCLSADWAGALELLNSFLSVFDLLLASFLRGCLVGLLSLGCSPFSLSFPGGVLGPVSFGLLFASACSVCPCLSGCLVCVRSLWCSCGVAGSCWPLVVVVFPPRLLCSFLLLLCGVASVWPVLSWLRPLPVLPSPSVGPLVPSGPVSVLLVPPSGYLVVFATARLSCLWCGVW